MRRVHALGGAVFVTALLAATLTTAGRAPRAAALVVGSGELRGGTLSVGIERSQGTAPVQLDARSRSLPALVRYRATPLPGGRVGDLVNLCNASGQPVTDESEVVFGRLFDVVGYTSDGQVVSDAHECVPLPDPDNPSAVPPPPALPVAPTIGDVWREVPLPRPVVGVNPVTRGVTGLDTWLWSGGAQTVPVEVTMGGFRVTGVARVVEYRFFTDEGYLGATTAPGDSARPAATHRFATKGAHSLSVASVWRAVVTMVGPGGPRPVSLDIDTAVLTATVGYPVVEVRSRLVS